MGVGLAHFGVSHLLRLGPIDTGWAAAAFPPLASMFIFRLAIFLYDRHRKGRRRDDRSDEPQMRPDGNRKISSKST